MTPNGKRSFAIWIAVILFVVFGILGYRLSGDDKIENRMEQE